MIKKLLLTSAIAFTAIVSMQAQMANDLKIESRTFIKNIPGNSSHKSFNNVATANCVDTNYYVYFKDNILNSTVGYYALPSTAANKYSLGYSYANTGTITVTALGFLAASGNTTIPVPAVAYLYNVNGAGVPTTKIDSMFVTVSTAKFYYGNLFTSPRVLTTNFAVVLKLNSAVATQTLSMYMTAAQNGTATVNNFGEGRGYVGTGAASAFISANAGFAGTNDFEPLAFPIYSYNMTADYVVTPISPVCTGVNVINTNTSSNTNVAENYMFNFARFAKKWNITSITGLDSIYIWNFSDATGRFINKNQNHTYNTAGTFNDSLMYTNNAWSGTGICFDRKVTPITVIATPTITLTPTSVTICPSGVATFSASGASSYLWQGGQTTSFATFSPASSQSYTVTSSNMCGTSTKTANVVVSTIVTINAASSMPNICRGQSSTLTVTGAINYTWTPSTTLSSANGTPVTASPTVQTTYTITGTSSCGTGTTSLTQSVTPLPVVSVTGSTTQVCNGSAATLTASGANTYNWMPISSTNTVVSVTPTGNTTYSVTGTTSGCSATKTISINVNSLPTLNVTASTPSICAGQSATLTANTNGTFILWSTTATTSVVAVSPTVTTTYSVGVTNGSCNASSTIMMTVATCTTTGVDELSGLTINVFPNPTTGILNIAVPTSLVNASTVEVYDAIGKLVISQNLTNEQNAISTSNLSNGVYIYKIVNANKAVKIGRVVKQ